ncbi:MAG TPA: hypothetical protein VFE47_18765 [Tepidisphaeraceae bacterium]|jgi:hypothetical protein|nr:hypothetical protein [Tepidisphaeraceae bacterium]
MKFVILSAALVVAGIASPAASPDNIVLCQASSVTEAAAKELIEVMLREGGSQAASELVEMGGAAAVRQLLENAMNEGGEELVQRVAQYGTRYGPAALRAMERSPARMVRALDGMQPDLVAPAIRAAARQPEVMDQLVATYGKTALEVAAKHPGFGVDLAEKLGGDGIRIGQNLTTDQAVTLARYADDIAALPSAQRNQLLDAILRAPVEVLDYLETHPKVLLTAGGAAVVIAAKDNLLGGSTLSPNPATPPPGLGSV